MKISTFIYCDKCNPQGSDNIYDSDHHDMRSVDGRSRYEGSLDSAIKLGWQLTETGDVLCSHCVNNGMARLLIDDRWNSHEILLNIKLYQQAHK